MAVTNPEKKSRRIAVILDAGGSSQNLLDQVLPLIGNDRDIEMQGVFLEEAEVQHAAELPFVQELCRVTFSVREFTSDQFEKALALRMRTARRALDVLSRRTGIAHSFRNVRGSAVSLLCETASVSDITVFEPARVASAAIVRAVRPGQARRHIVAVIGDRSSAGHVLRAAAHLAEGRLHSISIVLFPAGPEQQAGIQQDVQDFLNGRPAQVRTIGQGSVDSLAATTRELGASMLVIPAMASLVEPDSLRLLRDQLRCPICIVRRWQPRRSQAD